MRRRAAAMAAAAAVAGAVAAGQATAAGTSTGTLLLAEAEGADRATVSYRWDAAPLLKGPAAARAAGLRVPIRASATRYLPVTLEAFTGPLPSPPACAGFVSRPVELTGSIADPRALVQLNDVTLDVRRGRGRARVELAPSARTPSARGSTPPPGCCGWRPGAA